MDPVVSVQNKNFSGNRKEFTKVLGADVETRSQLHWQFLRIWQSLLQSGLDEKWQADAMGCYCYLRYIQDLLSDWGTLCERRFGEPFKEPIIPFGSMVEYQPISAKDLSRLHQFGTKVSPGIFLSYVFYAGGIWKGDIMVADRLCAFGNWVSFVVYCACAGDLTSAGLAT